MGTLSLSNQSESKNFYKVTIAAIKACLLTSLAQLETLISERAKLFYSSSVVMREAGLSAEVV